MLPMTNTLTRCLLSGILCLCFATQFANAGMISTEQFETNVNKANAQQTITYTLQRHDVRTALISHGVHPSLVEKRIDQLTEDEIQLLAEQFDSLPAASGVGLVLFATGPIVFMLELMGFTDLTTTF